VPGYHLVIPADAARKVWMEFLTRFGPTGGDIKRPLRPIGWAAFNAARIEGGRPIFGIDFDDSILPHETGPLLNRAVSFTKGCYPGQEPVVWMDGLDIRIVQTFAAQFHEVYAEEVQPVSRSEGASVARFGQGLAPLGAAAPFGKTSPIFNYPYERSRDSLAMMAKDQDPDACHGWKMEFINPLTGGHAIPTIAAFIQVLPKGFQSKPYRCTDGTVFSVVEGTGSVTIGEQKFDFEPRDTFVVPSWFPLQIQANSEAVLFSFSDRPGQEAMGLWREKKG
jgi:gentisate 1,2-dioxygenase